MALLVPADPLHYRGMTHDTDTYADPVVDITRTVADASTNRHPVWQE
jgi:hypothetical protein